MTKNITVLLATSLFFLTIFVSQSSANNLSITNVSLKERNPSLNTVVVEFDVSWNNSWKTKINHDAIWTTVRLYDPSVLPTDKKLCELSGSGLNPAGTSVGTNDDLEIVVPADKKGVFIRPSVYGTTAISSSENVQLTIDYSTCGFASSDNVHATVFGIEMVFVPEGTFYAGDYNTSTASLQEGSSDSDPWRIFSESIINVTDASSNGYRYVSAGNVDEDATGSTFSIGAAFPKGYASFYAMKYEISEGEWVEFVNSLPSASARAQRDITNSNHKNSDTVISRNTISCSGSPLTCSTQRPARALSYISWMDLLAFLDWEALRPMTELEFEKLSRGPLLPVEGEFCWGSTDITSATTLSSGDEAGAETVTNSNANANYNNVTFTGGDSAGGPDYAQGPLRGGIFATSDSTRITSGAAYYGLMEVSGNVAERVVSIGNVFGRLFQGTHGDGILTTLSGYEGNANQEDWPGIDDIADRGVTQANGSGFKGGSWQDQASGAFLRISDRRDAAKASTSALSTAGGRGVRTYNEN